MFYICTNGVFVLKTGSWIAIKSVQPFHLKQQKSCHKTRWPWYTQHANGQLGLNRGLGYLYIMLLICNVIDPWRKLCRIDISWAQSHVNIFHSIIWLWYDTGLKYKHSVHTQALIILFSCPFLFLPLHLPHLPLSPSPSLSLLSLHQLLLLLQSQSEESPHPPAQTETKGLIRLLNTAPFLHPSLHARP